MNIYAFSSLVVAVVVFYLGTKLYVNNPNQLLTRLLFLISVSVAFLSLIEFEISHSATAESAYFCYRFANS